MVLTKTDEERREELDERFHDQEGWSEDLEFRIQEKEADAERCMQKLLLQMNSLLENTSLLAVNNDLLLELLEKSSNFFLEVNDEAQRRE